MRIPNSTHTSRPWRIHEIAPDFAVEDVWALPTHGGPDEFPRLVRLVASSDPSRTPSSSVAGLLWSARWKLGAVLGWDGPGTGVDGRVRSLRDRLPADLRGATGPEFAGLPFRPVYLTGDEFVAETANRTVHAAMHVGWVPDGAGGHRGQLAVLVKPNGPLGAGYLKAIAPLRERIVYPAMMRRLERGWRASATAPS
jgi:hypothetical protein